MWLAEAGLYHYKARAYHPGLGRFLQTDPIGYAGGMNMYAYVGNDPVNATDPSGLTKKPPADQMIVKCNNCSSLGSGAGFTGVNAIGFLNFQGGSLPAANNLRIFGYIPPGRFNNGSDDDDDDPIDEIVVTATRHANSLGSSFLFSLSMTDFILVSAEGGDNGNGGGSREDEEEEDACKGAKADENLRQAGQASLAGAGVLCGQLAPLCAALGGTFGDDAVDAAHQAGCREGQRRREREEKIRELEARGCIAQLGEVGDGSGPIRERWVCPDGSIHGL